MLEPGDIPSLQRRYSKGMGISKKTVSTHNPLDGICHRNDDGSHLYNTPAMNGLMEPHVFARFQPVLFNADFSFTAEESYLYINDEFNIDTDERKSRRRAYSEDAVVKKRRLNNQERDGQIALFVVETIGGIAQPRLSFVDQ